MTQCYNVYNIPLKPPEAQEASERLDLTSRDQKHNFMSFLQIFKPTLMYVVVDTYQCNGLHPQTFRSRIYIHIYIHIPTNQKNNVFTAYSISQISSL